MKATFKKQTPALTLMELIIAVIIINVISVLAFTKYSKFLGVQRKERVRVNMNAIHTCMQIHKIKRAYYPSNNCDNLSCINNTLQDYGCNIHDETPELHYAYSFDDLEVIAEDDRYNYLFTLYLREPLDHNNPFYDDNPGAGS